MHEDEGWRASAPVLIGQRDALVDYRRHARFSAIPAEPSSPMITVLAALAFRKHRCENTPLT
jgi:hypothetical protein